MAQKMKYVDGVLVPLTEEDNVKLEEEKVRRENNAAKYAKRAARIDRFPLLQEVDYKINILEDEGKDASSWRAYRQELRDITEDLTDYKKIVWPSKPGS